VIKTEFHERRSVNDFRKLRINNLTNEL